MFMASTQLAFVLEQNGIRNPADRSWYMGSVTVIAAATSFAYGWLQARLTVLGTFAFSLLCMSVAAGVIGFGSSSAMMILGASLIGIYVGVLGPYVYHVVTEHTDAFSRSRAIGLLSAFGFLGGFLNPVIFATMSDAIGLRNVFYVVSLLMALLALGTTVRLVRQRATISTRMT
jgi:MFS family permease